MQEIEQITQIIRDRGSDLNREDMLRIRMLAVEVPLEESESLSFAWEAIALIVNDPLYTGDIAPIE